MFPIYQKFDVLYGRKDKNMTILNIEFVKLFNIYTKLL